MRAARETEAPRKNEGAPPAKEIAPSKNVSNAIELAKLRRIVEIALAEHVPEHQFEALKAAEESERTILRQLAAGLGSAAA